MDAKTSPQGKERKVVARIQFTEEQKKIIAGVAGRQIETAQIVHLSEEETRRLAPGLISAAAIVMCW
jgi:hypothetical protein